jgi:hypothetical protein
MQLISGIVRYKSKVKSKNCFFEKRKTITSYLFNHCHLIERIIV